MWLSILTQKLIPYGESDHLEVKIFRKNEHLFAKEKKIILNKLKRKKSFCSRKIPLVRCSDNFFVIDLIIIFFLISSSKIKKKSTKQIPWSIVLLYGVHIHKHMYCIIHTC